MINDELFLENGEKSKSGFFRRLIKDYQFRTVVFAVFSAVFTSIYGAISGVFAAMGNSVWYAVFCAYLLILAVVRMLNLAIYGCLKIVCRNDGMRLYKVKQKIYIANGGVFVLFAISLGIVITLLYQGQKPVESNKIFAIMSAAYAFFKITAALVNLKKTKRYCDSVLLTVRDISLIDAMASVLLLENTLPLTFGALDSNIRIVIAVTGMAVCLLTVAIGIYMIRNGCKNLSR